MPKKNCRGVFHKDAKLLQKMTEEEIKKDIICVPNKIGVDMFYKLDYNTNNKFKFIGYKNLMTRCFNTERIDLPKCAYTSAVSINPDYHLIQIYLESLHNERFSSEIVKDSTLSELEKLKLEDPTNKVWNDTKFITELSTKFSDNKIKLKNFSEHILEFINYLLQYTDITLEKIDQMFKGGYTIIQGDSGYIYKKFLKMSEKQIKESIQKGVSHKNMENPIAYAYASNISVREKDAGIYTHKEIGQGKRQYLLSSHKSKDYTQLRMGAGSIINCIESSQSCLNEEFELLMGTSAEPEYNGDTWFQFEQSRMATVFSFISHIGDFAKYQATIYGEFLHIPGVKKMNVGPFGMSEYHDTHPQILSICSINDDGIIEDCIHKVA
jgi:hypothetical protein